MNATHTNSNNATRKALFALLGFRLPSRVRFQQFAGVRFGGEAQIRAGGLQRRFTRRPLRTAVVELRGAGFVAGQIGLHGLHRRAQFFAPATAPSLCLPSKYKCWNFSPFSSSSSFTVTRT